MQAALRPLTPISHAGEPVPPTRIRLDGERITVDHLVVHDRALAAFLAERPADDRPELVQRAVRIGLLALQDVGITVNVDVVRAEFEKLMRQAESVNEKAALALEQTLRANFADGDGRLPRTLEKFLGDRGALRSMVDELFDESKRDSAIGRKRDVLTEKRVRGAVGVRGASVRAGNRGREQARRQRVPAQSRA